MTTIPGPSVTSGSNSLKALCRLIGIACLSGFFVDLFVLSFPPTFSSLEWRVSFMQQLGDRSIILLFGLALLMYGILDHRQWRRRLALTCLILGAAFTLSSILVIRDSLQFQEQTLITINQQASNLKTQIQSAQDNPQISSQIDPERLQQATQALNNQAEALRQNTKTGTLRTGVSSVGNLIVLGIALIGLGQYGSRPPKD